MNLSSRLSRIERLHQAQNPCPLCARHQGMKLVSIMEHGEKFDIESLACPACGARPEDPLVVHLVDDALPLVGVGAGERAP